MVCALGACPGRGFAGGAKTIVTLVPVLCAALHGGAKPIVFLARVLCVASHRAATILSH